MDEKYNDFMKSIKNENKTKSFSLSNNMENNPKIGNVKADDTIDPLDAFMGELNKNKTNKKKTRGERLDLELENSEKDDFLSNTFVLSNAQKMTDPNYNSDEEIYAADKAAKKIERIRSGLSKVRGDIQFDEKGNPLVKQKITLNVEDLKPIDHSKINYSHFVKNIYSEHPDIRNKPFLKPQILNKHGLKIEGQHCPTPCEKFIHFGLNSNFTENLISKHVNPTAIQMAAVPAILSGENIIAVSETGTGKTMAFGIPVLERSSRRLKTKGSLPFALIIAPTHELCTQIGQEMLSFAACTRTRLQGLYGGVSYHSQEIALNRGTDVVIGTPGRIINLIHKKILNCSEINILVLDEVDRMLDMGFKRQILNILTQIRPDRQTLLFSATLSNETLSFAKKTCHKSYYY